MKYFLLILSMFILTGCYTSLQIHENHSGRVIIDRTTPITYYYIPTPYNPYWIYTTHIYTPRKYVYDVPKRTKRYTPRVNQPRSSGLTRTSERRTRNVETTRTRTVRTERSSDNRNRRNRN